MRRGRLLLTATDVAVERPISGRDLAYLVLAAGCWGIGTVVSKRALAEVPPLTLLAIQLAVSVGVLAVVLRRRGPAARRGAPRLLGRLGLLNPGLAYALSLLGLVTISASLSVLLWALEPLLIVVLAAWLLDERITRRLAVLTAVAVAGMVVVVYDPTSAGALGGVALTVAGIGCCAVYSVITRRWLPDAESTTGEVVLAQQAHALGFALVLVLGLAVVGGEVSPATPTVAGVVSAVGSGVLYYAAAYWFYLAALKNLPASRAVLSFYLIPIIGVAASFALLGERLGPQQWVGAAIVIAAVVASARTPTAKARAAPERATVVGRP